MSLRECGCHRGVIMEVGLSSCHQPVYSAGCTANTSNVKTGSFFPERAKPQNSSQICQCPRVISHFCWSRSSRRGCGVSGLNRLNQFVWLSQKRSVDGTSASRSDIWEASGRVQTEQLAADPGEARVMSSDGSSRSEPVMLFCTVWLDHVARLYLNVVSSC